MEQVTLLTSKDVQNLCAISRSALYRLMKKKKFSLPVKIGGALMISSIGSKDWNMG